MRPPRPSKLTLHPTKVDTGNADEHAVMVAVDERIAAIFVRLDDPCHDLDQGHWHLEASFGRCESVPRPPFPRLEDGLRWVAGRLGMAGDPGALLSPADRDLLQDAGEQRGTLAAALTVR